MKALFENIFFKMGMIFILILLLLIPSLMVQDLIEERTNRQNEVEQEVGLSHAGSQTLAGPILTLPYTISRSDAAETEVEYLHILPEQLIIEGEVKPEKRNRGLFEVVVYTTELNVKGEFQFNELSDQGFKLNRIHWEEAFFTIGISELEGIREPVKLNLNAETLEMKPGVRTDQVVSSGLHARHALDSLLNPIAFNFTVSLNGSGSLDFTPVGKTTEVHMKSAWQDPGFQGSFLPVNRTVSSKGFTADWKVLNLNRNYPQAWLGESVALSNSDFGVDLRISVDRYQKTTRVAKYAIMFIVFTFLVFFFVEVLNKVLIHPIQYILVGLALVLFYLLLLSFTEQMDFNLAYFLAAAMTMLMVLIYSRSILKSWGLAIMTGAILSTLYGFIFILIQMQDYALLFGSLGTFLVLAITMYFSRKVDWFELKKGHEKMDESD